MTISYGDDVEYASAKLVDSIVRYEGWPCTVLSVEDVDGVFIQPLLRGINKTVCLSDLDLAPIPLGYMNLKPAATFVMRIPSRSWKQGLRMHNINARSRISLNSPEFVNCVMGIYPKLDEAIEQIVNDEYKDIAISRVFSLSVVSRSRSRAIHLNYKGVSVGTFDLDKSKHPTFDTQWNFLSELYEGMTNR